MRACVLTNSPSQRQGVFVPKLYLSHGIESLIGSASSLALPAVPPGICLMDYVDRIMELLEGKVQKTIHSFEARKQFIAEVRQRDILCK